VTWYSVEWGVKLYFLIANVYWQWWWRFSPASSQIPRCIFHIVTLLIVNILSSLETAVVLGDTDTKPVHSRVQVSARPADLQVSAGVWRWLCDWSEARTLPVDVAEKQLHLERPSPSTAAFCSAVCVAVCCLLLSWFVAFDSLRHLTMCFVTF